jgi:hypothetical protein
VLIFVAYRTQRRICLYIRTHRHQQQQQQHSYHTYTSNLVSLLLHRIHRLFRTTFATTTIDLEALVGAPICHLCEILQ